MSTAVFKVKIFDSRGTQVLQIAKSTMTIGSASHCDVVLDHPSVHAEHARAWLEGGRVWVQDLGSQTGTSLNDVRLPNLKPMLVRELDTLRLGSCESAVGLEPNLVRPPIVRNKTPSPDLTVKAPMKDVELGQRREELETVARELAETRRLLQMAKLEKTASDDISHQVESLRLEIRAGEEQRKKWMETVRQLEAERQQMRKEQESELRGLQLRAHSEKTESMGEFAKRLRGLSSDLVRRWTTRPLSQDMIFEWEGETLQVYRDVVMHGLDSIPAIPNLPPLPSVPNHPSEDFDGKPGETSIRSLPRSNEESGAAGGSRPGRESKRMAWLRPALLGGVGLVILAGCIWLGLSLFKRSGHISFSSDSGEIKEPAHRTPATRFEPKQGHKYRGSYAENVLYLENYVDAEQNPDFHRLWQKELNKVAMSDWKMEDGALQPVTVKELALIQDLSRMRNSITADQTQEGLAQMQEREARFLQELETQLKSHAAVDRFLKFKRLFYLRNQAYLSKESL